MVEYARRVREKREQNDKSLNDVLCIEADHLSIVLLSPKEIKGITELKDTQPFLLRIVQLIGADSVIPLYGE